MKLINWQTRNRRNFLSKKSNLHQIVRHTYIDNNTAVIPCHAKSYDDIISSYSVEGFETLNPAFQEYMLETIRYIPDEYPIVLKIQGAHFSAKEQDVIAETIKTDMLYALGEVEEENREAFRNFLWMVAGAVGMGVFLTLAKFVVKIEEEFFYIVFWFFADTIVRYLLHDRSARNYSKLLAGRLASMSVRFDSDN